MNDLLEMSFKRNLEDTPSSDLQYSTAKSTRLLTPQLNYDTLAHVFKYLPNKRTLSVAAQVCSEWNCAAYDPSLWKNSIADFRNKPVSEQTAISLCRRKIRGVQIMLETSDDSMPCQLERLAEIVKVEVMMIDPLKATDDITKSFPKTFASLRCLSLTHYNDTDSITSQGLERLVAPLVNLEQLNVAWGENPQLHIRKPQVLKFNYFEFVFFFVPSLRDLEITMIGKCNGFDFSRLSPTDRYHNIERLVLHQVDTDLHLIAAVSIHFPSLKHFAVELGSYDTDKELDYSHRHKNLESLKANSPYYMQWSVENLSIITETSRNLTALDLALLCHLIEEYHNADDLRQLQDTDIELIFNNLPGLKMLNVFGQFVSLKPFNNSVERMKNLEVLVLGSIWSDEETRDKDRFFYNLKHNWTNIESILGVEFDADCYKHLGNVCYIGGGDREILEEWNEDITKLEFSTEIQAIQKVEIEQYSPAWQRAVGKRFFQLPSTYTF